MDLHGRDLVVLEHDVRRTPISAATPELLSELRAALFLSRGHSAPE